MLAPLAASLVEPVISSAVKGTSGRDIRRAGRFLIPFHPLSNIEITKYSNYEPRFNGVFSRKNLSRIRDGAYVINLNDKKN